MFVDFIVYCFILDVTISHIITVKSLIVVIIIIIIIIIIYRFLKRHKSLGYRGAGGVSIRRTVGIGKS